ncbi:MAG: hypothetical protein QOG43_2876 [Actinomycetota bacterium]|jgi:hypothetical protein|nr:hypothetical protein [Actinomycetota bacterium]
MKKVIPTLALVAVLALGACGGGDDDDPATAAPTDPSTVTTARATTDADPPCGVTLADVQKLLPPGSGVSEHSTPDPGRCNFTWDDGGPRGIDVATVPGGRAAFSVPAGYEPLDGYGDEAFVSTDDGQASAFAFAGDDLYAADVVAPGTGAAEADLRNLCLQLLRLALD